MKKILSDRAGYSTFAATLGIFFVFSYGLQPYLYKLANPELGQGYPTAVESISALSIAAGAGFFLLAGVLILRYPGEAGESWIPIRIPNLRLIFTVVLIAGLALNGALLTVGGGITIYVDGIQMPGSFTGVVSALRVIAFPGILGLLFQLSYRDNNRGLAMFTSGILLYSSISSIASGSHFVAMMTSLPLLLAPGFKRWQTAILFALGVAINLILAAGSRIFFLPFWLDDWLLHDNYFEAWQLAGSSFLPVLLTPLLYPINRVSGLYELSLTAKYFEGNFLSEFSLWPFASFLLPWIGRANHLSARDVLEIQEASGGFGLDLVSNLWLAWGPNVLALFIGCVTFGALLGIIYKSTALVFSSLHLPAPHLAISCGLLLLVFSPSLGSVTLVISMFGLGILGINEALESDNKLKPHFPLSWRKF